MLALKELASTSVAVVVIHSVTHPGQVGKSCLTPGNLGFEPRSPSARNYEQISFGLNTDLLQELGQDVVVEVALGHRHAQSS